MFCDVRRAVSDREDVLKKKINELIEREELVTEGRCEAVRRQLEAVALLKKEVEISLHESEVHLLANKHRRRELVESATLPVASPAPT